MFVTGHADGNIYRVTETSLEWNYTADVTDVSCPGDADGAIIITLSSFTPSPLLVWSDGGVGSIRENLSAGEYQVTITAINGASAVETYIVASTISLEAVVTGESCPGSADGAIDLTLNGAVEPSTAIWSDGFNGFDRTGLAQGSYTVTITTDEGCSFVEDYLITPEFDNPATPVISVEDDTILHAGGGYSSYQWLLNGAIIAGATSADFTAIESGEYTVVVTNEGGCEAISMPVVISITEVQELLPGFSLLFLTPNPFDEALYLNWEAGAVHQLNISISDTTGKQFFQETMEMSGKAGRTLDVTGLPAGIYFFTVSENGKSWSQKIMKQ